MFILFISIFTASKTSLNYHHFNKDVLIQYKWTIIFLTFLRKNNCQTKYRYQHKNHTDTQWSNSCVAQLVADFDQQAFHFVQKMYCFHIIHSRLKINVSISFNNLGQLGNNGRNKVKLDQYLSKSGISRYSAAQDSQANISLPKCQFFLSG